MAKQVLLFAFILLFSQLPPTLSAQQPDTLILDLRQCEERALANSQMLKQATMKVAFAEARQAQASHAAILPKFELKNTWGPISQARASFNEFGVLNSPDTTFQFGDLRYYTEVELNLLQPLFTFGKLSGVKQAAHFGLLAENAGRETTEEDVRLRVRQLYWTILVSRELLKVVDEARQEIEKANGKIQEKLEEGSEDVSQNDLFKLQIYTYEVNKLYRETQDEIAIASAELKSILGLDPKKGIEIATEYLEAVEVNIDSLSMYEEISMRNRSELAQVRSGVRAKQALVSVAKSDYYPQFFFGGQIKYNYAKDRYDSSNPFVYNPTNFFRPGVLIGMNLNLNFLQTRDKVRVAAAEYKSLTFKEELLAQKVKIEVRTAYQDLVRAQANMQESRRALRATESWLRSESMTWDIGVGEVKGLIDAFQANSKMRSEHLKNIQKFNTALARLSRAIGQDLYPN